MKKKVLFCWSGGKDSALALYRLLNNSEFEVVALLTTINREFQRVSMHGVREELLELQALSIGIPLDKMYLEKNSSNEEYEERMKEKLLFHKSMGVDHVAFGDIFLEDLKKFREENLAKVDMKGIFPLWKDNTERLIKEFLDLGFKTVLCCVHNDYLDDSFTGRIIDENFLIDLPKNVDPCGENGEYHTFVYDGPLFKKTIGFQFGEKVKRSYEVKRLENGVEVIDSKSYCFIDLLKK